MRATRILLTKLLSSYFLDAPAPLDEVFITAGLPAHATAPWRVSSRVFGLRCLQSQWLSYGIRGQRHLLDSGMRWSDMYPVCWSGRIAKSCKCVI